MLSAQNQPGFPGVKLFSISNDNGYTWTKPEPLCYEDGSYAYSAANFPETFRSTKNGKPYVIINISPKPCAGCDPRTALHIAELSTDPVAIKRDSVAIIEERMPEHHHLVRYSMWKALENRDTGNVLLLMKMAMSEMSPMRNGYDFNCYRYEIVLPD